MATPPMSRVIQHLLAACGREDGTTDGELLTRFLSGRADDALTALVRRHGPMVWGVCCRLLRTHPDAEDAFQATFLVLVQKAATLPNRETVGNWLYGVAHQTAVRMRAVVAKRGVRERQVTVLPEPATAEQYVWNDLLPVLDEELSRLPDKYRVLVVLCDLEGVTRKEVARRLGIPEGTAASRLATARAMLARRLARRGVAVSGPLLGAVLSHQSAWAGVPTAVANSTIKAATMVAAGHAAGAISPTVAALKTGVIQAMFMTKIKSVLAVLLAVGLVAGATGVGVLSGRTTAGQDEKKPTAEKPVEPAAKQEKEKEAFTAWGERVGRLQVGLGFRPGEQRAYRHGETVTLVVRVRNVSEEEVKVEHLKKFFDENPPTVTGADGKSVPRARLTALGFHEPEEVSFPPGKEIELASVQFDLLPASERGKARTGRFPTLYVEAGKVSLQYDRVFGNTSSGSIKVNPDWLKLATGKLELEIKADPQENKDVGGKADQPEATTPPTDRGPVAPKLGVAVEAADLGKVTKTNQARFDEQYTDKTFQVRGKVTRIFRTKRELASTDGEADYVVEMESAPLVQFLVPAKHRKALAELKVNERATVRGFCCGMRSGAYTPTGIEHGEKSICFYAVEVIDGKGAGTTATTEEKR